MVAVYFVFLIDNFAIRFKSRNYYMVDLAIAVFMEIIELDENDERPKFDIDCRDFGCGVSCFF